MGKSPQQSLLHSLRWFLAAYAVAIVGYVGLGAVAGRMLGTAGLGQFVAVLTVTQVAGLLGLIGVQRAGVREAAWCDPDDPEHLTVLGTLRGGVRAVSLVALPVVALAVGVGTAAVMGGDLATRLLTGGVAAGLTWASGMQKLLAGYLRGLGRLRTAGLLEGRSGGALVSLGQALLITAVWQLRPQWGLSGALAAALLGFLLPLAVAGPVLHRAWSHAPVERGLGRHLRTVLARDWRMASSQVGGFLNSSLDLWLCLVLLPASAASLFAAGQRLAQLLLIPTTAMQVVFSPAIARIGAEPDRPRLQQLVRTGSSIGTAVVASAYLPMVVVPGLLVGLVYGPDFEGAALVLVPLATAYLCNAVSGMSGVTLSMTRNEGFVARVQWTAVAARLVLGVIGAWVAGLAGVVAASSSVTVGFYALMWWHARSRAGVMTHLTLRPRLALLREVAG